MAEPMKSRFAIDLDDLERQLRDTASGQPKAAPADPLAELARIVGQDDPFKKLFSDKPAPSPVQAAPSAAPAASVAQAPPGLRDRDIEDLLRDFDLSVGQPSAGGQTSASAPLSSEPTIVQPQASHFQTNQKPPSAPDPLADAFDAMLRDEFGPEPVKASAAEPSTRTAAAGAAGHLQARDLQGRELPTIDEVEAAVSRARDLDEPDAPGARRDAFADGDARALDDRSPDDRFATEAPPADYPEPPAEPVEDMRSLEPRQPRKGMLIAASLMGVAALGIGAVVGLGGLVGGGGGATATGDVPVVRAEPGPAKVAPANPGGVDIPNQNKQIFERAGEAKPAETRVVNREEQPMDVQAAARQAARVILPTPGADPQAAPAAPVTPPPSAPVAAASEPPAASVQPAQPPALGEPRRVRTVSVRPDGTIAPPPGTPEAAPAAPPASPPASPPSAAAPAARTAPPTTTGSAPVVRAPTPPRPPVAEAPRQQVAAVPPPAAPRSSEPRASEPAAPRAGGWMVQLAAPGSEAEARARFSSLQRQHSAQLAGETPVVRRAEANGRTVYRLRVGPFSREEAASKCEAIKADGGQCFLATN